MGNIAPPLVKPFFSLGGTGHIQVRNIQGDSVDEARQAQRQEQAMQDDCRLGLAKNQQWIRTTDTSKILTSNYQNVDFQKIEHYPPEVYSVPAFIPPPKVPQCLCFDSSKIVWGGSWLQSDSGDPKFSSGLEAGWIAWFTGSIVTNVVPFDLIDDWPLGAAYPYIASLYIQIWHDFWEQRDLTYEEFRRCHWTMQIDPSLGKVLYWKWLEYNAITARYHISSAPYGSTYLNCIVAVNETCKTQCAGGTYSGPFYDFGWEPFPPDSRTTQSPLFLYCDGEVVGGIPLSIDFT